MSRFGYFFGAALVFAAVAIGSAGATPLATFAWAEAQDYVDFPINDEDIAKGPFATTGTLVLTRPDSVLTAMGQKYVYGRSLIAYFDFFYSFTGDHGEFIDDQYFTLLFDSPNDYIELGAIPVSGLLQEQTFDGQALIAEFTDRFHGLQDNSWSITGFRASVRHIYYPPEPATIVLVCLGIAAALGLRGRPGAGSATIPRA